MESPCERRIFTAPVSYALTMPFVTLPLTHSSYRSRTGGFAVKGQRLNRLTNEPDVPDEIRTRDNLIKSQVLCQLSYGDRMRFRLKAGPVFRSEDPPWKIGSLKRRMDIACRTRPSPLLFRSNFCRNLPLMAQPSSDSDGIRTRISNAAPSCKVSRRDARQEIRI